MPDKIYLRQMQSLPLIVKVHMSQARISEWYRHWDGNVCISFSGGKDSTVLAHLVHEFYPDVPMVFCNTGLEYPEIQAFAKKMGAEFVRPKMRFDEVISKYGYPIISKENAEAIYYARKIRNSIGGGITQTESLFQGRTGWRRAALTSQIPSKIIGGVSVQKRRELNGLPRQDGSSTEATAETRSSTESTITLGGGMTDTHRKRSNLMGLRNQYEQIAMGNGSTGDETPLPG